MADGTSATDDHAIKVKIKTRADRLLRLIELKAPWPVVSNECWLLRSAVHQADHRWGVGAPDAEPSLEEDRLSLIHI